MTIKFILKGTKEEIADAIKTAINELANVSIEIKEDYLIMKLTCRSEKEIANKILVASANAQIVYDRVYEENERVWATLYDCINAQLEAA